MSSTPEHGADTMAEIQKDTDDMSPSKEHAPSLEEGVFPDATRERELVRRVDFHVVPKKILASWGL
ncbi:hypothetical protein ABW20_dc0103655 [Dactylellina cionopaga]|nr:hypothetical protein ABW20_dc0103655 [Dactylellina cionopaga]